MSSAGRLFPLLDELCLKPHVFGAAPAWLWSADGSRLLWANAPGAAAFGARTRTALLADSRVASRERTAELGRLAGVLPSAGSRIARLRSFSNAYGQPGLFSCARVKLSDGSEVLLVVANDAPGKVMPLEERVRGLMDGARDVAVLGPDGAVLFAASEVMAAAAAHTRATSSELKDEAPVDDVKLRHYPSEAGPVVVATRSPVGDGAGTTQPPNHAQAALAPPRSLRFTWQTDAALHFTILSDEFISLAGARTAAMQGKHWYEVAKTLELDPGGAIASALASRQTWENIEVGWPMGDSGARLGFSLSATPIKQGDGGFGGYRGFAQCREASRIAEVLASKPAGKPAAEPAAPLASPAPIAKAATVTQPQVGKSPARVERKPNVAKREAAHAEQQPLLTVVPAVRNIVPFRSSTSVPNERRASLSPVEHNAFQEIARALGARFAGDATAERADLARLRSLNEPDPDLEAFTSDAEADDADLLPEDFVEEISRALEEGAAAARRRAREDAASADVEIDAAPANAPSNASPGLPAERAILDRMPVAALVYRGSDLLYANRSFHEWTGFVDLPALQAAGGFERLFDAPVPRLSDHNTSAGQTIPLHTQAGASVPVQGRLFSISWHDEQALLFLFTRQDDRISEGVTKPPSSAVKADEWAAILDIVAEGVVVLDEGGSIVTLNRSAQALFGYDSHELSGQSLLSLLAPASHREALLYLDGIRRDGMQSVLNEGREVVGRAREGGTISLFMTIGRIHQSPSRFCVILRDLTSQRSFEHTAAKPTQVPQLPAPGNASSARHIGDTLAAPLDAIIASATVLQAELNELGVAGDARVIRLDEIQKQLLGIRQVVSDATELGEIEAHARTLTFVHVDLNATLRECIASTQPAALEARVVIRAALSSTLPTVIADREAVREIVLRLLADAVTGTPAGGQIIISTAANESRAFLRLRHPGSGGASEQALSPITQAEVSVGASLMRALVEANGGTLSLCSAVGAGNLTEIAFPAARPAP